MTRQYSSQRFGSIVMQSAVPKREPMGSPFNPQGLLLRGVVTATYVLDDPSHPRTASQPVAVYCDVFCYGNVPGSHFRFLPACLVAQDRGGAHSGRIWKPKATTIDVSGDPLDPEGSNNPADLDGDHVLVGFLDNSFNLPVILAGLPHPNADLGNESLDIGQRKRLKLADGDPDFFRHHGSFYGISDTGDFVVDLRRATNGSLEADGTEPPAPGDGTVGNYRVKLPAASKLTVEIGGGLNLELDLKDGNAKLKLGDGAKSALIAEAWQQFFDGTFKTWVTTHTHPTAMGPSGTPVQSGTFPAYPVAATSTKLKIPDA